MSDHEHTIIWQNSSTETPLPLTPSNNALSDLSYYPRSLLVGNKNDFSFPFVSFLYGENVGARVIRVNFQYLTMCFRQNCCTSPRWTVDAEMYHAVKASAVHSSSLFLFKMINHNMRRRDITWMLSLRSKYKNKTLSQVTFSHLHMLNLSVCWAHKQLHLHALALSGAPLCMCACICMYMHARGKQLPAGLP